MMARQLVAAVALVAVSAAGGAWWARQSTPPVEARRLVGRAPAESAVAPKAHTPPSSAGDRIGEVPQAVGATSTGLVVPGVVEPNGYQQVEVTTLLAGTATDVLVVPGAAVVPGQVIARLRSPALADEFQAWRTALAERDVISRRVTRVTRLAAIGAASRQELEQAQADEVRAATNVDARRSRLLRMGIDETRLSGTAGADGLPDTFDVKATAGGVVVDRAVNVGMHVGEGDRVVTVADTAGVWVTASVYAPDLPAIRIGQRADVVFDGWPTRTWTGRVTYIEPSLASATRTARVRVEVNNPDRVLRFGMLATVTLPEAGGVRTERVPAQAEPAPRVPERVVEVTASGLVPVRVSVPAGTAFDLVLIRRVEQTCGTEVSIPDFGIRRELPLNTRVSIRIPAREPGELTFSCGMDMLKGVIVVTR